VTPEEIELLSELTIFIPTYKRSRELERAIEYWRDTPVTIHILDGSDIAFFPVGLQGGTNSIYYHSFPQNTETVTENWGRRLKFATSLMKTKFAAFCCDDDVFVVGGLIKALHLLSGGVGDAVAGKTGEYLLQNDEVIWTHKYPHWKDQALQRSVNVGERLMFDGGAHAFYGIYRSELLAKIHGIGNLYAFPVPVWHSMLIITLIKVFSRVIYVDDLFWLKCGINYPESRPIKFAQIFWDKRFVVDSDKFLEGLSLAIRVVDPAMTDDDILDLVTKFKNQFAKPKKWKKTVVKLKAQTLRTIGKLPQFVRETIFACLPSGLKKRIGNSNFEVNFKPVVSLSEQDLMNDSLKKWERILLMPREELRLKANI
jgi:hypothetical protein